MPDIVRVALDVNGEELGLLRALIALHADRQAMLAAQSGRALELLRGGAPLLALCATVEAAIEKLPETERPKPPPPRLERGRRE